MHPIATASASLMVFLVVQGSVAAGGDERYRDEVERWRQKREAALTAEDGWLSVTGLHWLQSGETLIGSSPASDLLLPARLPGVVGIFSMAGDRVEFQAAPGVNVTRNGASFDHGQIHSDAEEHPDTLAIDGVKLIVLKRGQRLAVRTKDNKSPLRAAFAGLVWYPVREEWRIQARFVASPAKTKLKMQTIVGEIQEVDSPGEVTFEREGKTYRLQAASEKNGKLWFVFRDGTSGKTTHGGARQLDAELPRDGIVTLDFNKAYNFPCAFIPYATCPLAPPRNRLSLPIEAGELKYEPDRKRPTVDQDERPSR